MPWTSPLLYTITDTAGDIVQNGLLQQEIENAGPTANPVVSIDAQAPPVGVGAIQVHFQDTSVDGVSDADKAIVDGAVAAHQGQTQLNVVARALVVSDPPVALGGAFATLGSVVFDPSTLIDPSNARLRSSMVVNATVGTALVRVVERRLSDGDEVIFPSVVVPVGSEQMLSFIDTPLRASENEYRLEGTLDQASTASVGSASLECLQAALIGLKPAT